MSCSQFFRFDFSINLSNSLFPSLQGDSKIHGNIYTYWAFHDVLRQHKLIRAEASTELNFGWVNMARGKWVSSPDHHQSPKDRQN